MKGLVWVSWQHQLCKVTNSRLPNITRLDILEVSHWFHSNMQISLIYFFITAWWFCINFPIFPERIYIDDLAVKEYVNKPSNLKINDKVYKLEKQHKNNGNRNSHWKDTLVCLPGLAGTESLVALTVFRDRGWLEEMDILGLHCCCCCFFCCCCLRAYKKKTDYKQQNKIIFSNNRKWMTAF